MWGHPIQVPRGQGVDPLNLLLFDTEGFEATGKADAYDDRIFALSTILSAILIYNLPETVRESDLQVKIWLVATLFVKISWIFMTASTNGSAETKIHAHYMSLQLLWLPLVKNALSSVHTDHESLPSSSIFSVHNLYRLVSHLTFLKHSWCHNARLRKELILQCPCLSLHSPLCTTGKFLDV